MRKPMEHRTIILSFADPSLVKGDRIKGVTESIILGQEMGIGTGACQVVMGLNLKELDVGKRETVFEDTWREIEGRRKGRAGGW